MIEVVTMLQRPNSLAEPNRAKPSEPSPRASTPGPGDRAFRRFRATADPEDLAEVFRETAQVLRRTARVFVPDTNTADDLVQSTFTVAIAGANQFDASRSVLPWLLGILSNRARRWQRASRRQPDPTRLPPRAEPDPASTAATQDLVEIIHHAIRGLPTTYRPVLELHLARGLSPAEIASELNRRRSTVRVQLVRGLQYLRRVLPSEHEN